MLYAHRVAAKKKLWKDGAAGVHNGAHLHLLVSGEPDASQQ